MHYNEAQEITKLYLHGQSGEPNSETCNPNKKAAVYKVDAQKYMNSGGGRFAVGSQFELIQKFFLADKSIFTEHSYNKKQLANIFGMDNKYGWVMQQRNYRDNIDDYAERVYVYNAQVFQISDDAIFFVGEDDDSRRIENYAIFPYQKTNNSDNFDFEGASGIVEFLGNLALGVKIDPISIGSKVLIEFQGEVTRRIYSRRNFFEDKAANKEYSNLFYLADSMNYLLASLYENEIPQSAFLRCISNVMNAISWGDPHYIDFCRNQFDNQQPGEYLLMGSRYSNFNIQTRQEFMPNSRDVSFNTGVAARLNTTKLSLYLPPKIKGWLQGSINDDVLQGNAATTFILGAEDYGQVKISAGGDIVFLQSNAGFSNSIGYYIFDENGYPTFGKIIWANAQATAANTVFNYESTVSKESLGFFIIPNGAGSNAIANGDRVTFQKINHIWTPCKNGLPLSSAYANAPAFYSNTQLNPDQVSHQRFIGNVQYWEDQYGGGDNNFINLIFSTSIQQSIVITGGDILIGSSFPESFVYQFGRDGVDTIKNFDANNDKIIIYGNHSQSQMKLIESNQDVLISFPSKNNDSLAGIFVENINVAAVYHRLFFVNTTLIQRDYLYVNDIPTRIDPEGSVFLNDSLIYRTGNQYYIFSVTRESFIATMYNDHIDLQVFLAEDYPADMTYGLLGPNSQQCQGHLLRKDSTSLGNNVPAQDFYNNFINDWRITQSNTLFVYTTGKNTSNFFSSSFSKRYLTYKDFPQKSIDDARLIAANSGYHPNHPLYENILFEILSGGININTLQFSLNNSHSFYKINVTNNEPTMIPSNSPNAENNDLQLLIMKNLVLSISLGVVAIFSMMAISWYCCYSKREKKSYASVEIEILGDNENRMTNV